MAKAKAARKSKKSRRVAPQPTEVVAHDVHAKLSKELSEYRMVIMNRELITVVKLPATKDGTEVGSFMLVPAKLAWLVNVASSFQSYQWLRIRVIYSPMVGDNVPGVVALGRSHDLNDKVPTTLANIAAQAGSSIGRVSLGCANTIEHTLSRPLAPTCIGFDMDSKRLKEAGSGAKLDYVTAATLDALSVDGKDRHVDLVVQWLTMGGSGTGEMVGHLWFHYVVELFNPTPYGSNY